jgi:hypothetical protein
MDCAGYTAARGQACSGHWRNIGHRLSYSYGTSQEGSHSDHACQGHEKRKEAAERIEAEVPKARLYLAKLDLAEFDSVRETSAIPLPEEH